jgi:hypothetical protein
MTDAQVLYCTVLLEALGVNQSFLAAGTPRHGHGWHMIMIKGVLTVPPLTVTPRLEPKRHEHE